MSKLCVAIHLYNAERHLEDTLYSLKKIKDIDVIHALDGAWMGYDGKMHSQDKTEQIFMKFREEYEAENPDIKLYYTWNNKTELWLSESKKRNWLLNDFDTWYPKQMIWTLVVDADEEIMLADNVPEMKLKPLLDTTKCGIIRVRDSQENCDAWYRSIRVIPHGLGYHYHTQKAMNIHDLNCNVMMDYELQVAEEKRVYELPQLYLVNKGGERTPEEIELKKKYFAYRQTHQGGRCRYRKL